MPQLLQSSVYTVNGMRALSHTLLFIRYYMCGSPPSKKHKEDSNRTQLSFFMRIQFFKTLNSNRTLCNWTREFYATWQFIALLYSIQLIQNHTSQEEFRNPTWYILKITMTCHVRNHVQCCKTKSFNLALGNLPLATYFYGIHTF